MITRQKGGLMPRLKDLQNKAQQGIKDLRKDADQAKASASDAGKKVKKSVDQAGTGIKNAVTGTVMELGPPPDQMDYLWFKFRRLTEAEKNLARSVFAD